MEKIKIWLQATGFKNIGLVLIGVLVLFFKLKFVSGIILGIFIYINFNVIQKLIRNVITKIDR